MYHSIMIRRLIIVLALLTLLCFVGLEVLKQQFGLGRYTENPQRVSLGQDRRAIVGGGKAILDWVGTRPKVEGESQQVELEVRCAEVEERVLLVQGDSTEEICGVRVRWIETTVNFQTGRPTLVVLVSWAESLEAGVEEVENRG